MVSLRTTLRFMRQSSYLLEFYFCGELIHYLLFFLFSFICLRMLCFTYNSSPSISFSDLLLPSRYFHIFQIILYLAYRFHLSLPLAIFFDGPHSTIIFVSGAISPITRLKSCLQKKTYLESKF